ncbi:MAG: Ig-like domain-containing protein [Kofleriaceae bacterium]|nr:Ig-like domain-containing protein [Kofleriaceae bacterium]
MTQVRWLGTLVLALAACGDDAMLVPDGDPLDAGAQPDTPDAPPDTYVDVTAPVIDTVTPQDGTASAWVHDCLVVTFSEPLAAASISTATIRVTDAMGTDLTASTSLLSGGRTVEVRVREEVMLFGVLRLEVTSGVTDVAGNHVAQPSTYTWQLSPWAKRPGGFDVGPAPSAPVIAATSEGAVLASSVGGTGARMIVVLDDEGHMLGGPLGKGSASAPSIATTEAGHVIVAWVETSTATIEAARWDGAAWSSLPSPGAGARPAVATSPSGALGIAWVGTGGLVARRYVGSTWVAAGTAAPVSSVVSDVALVMPDDTALVAAFVDRNGSVDQVRTLRFTTGLTEEPRLTLAAQGTSPHVSLAARGSKLALAWDEYSGYSLGAYAAVATSGGWNVLPMLDVDPPASARAPSVAFDIDGAPVVAWTEEIDGVQRGFVARWSGSGWKTIGGDAWTDAASQAPVRSMLALWHGRAPMVAWLETGAQAIDLARFNGPATARYGMASRPSLAGCSFDAANAPARLSQTGCFTITAGTAKPHPGLVPYDLRSELWTDGAIKRRWIAPPNGQAFGELANGSLDGPVGSFVIKEFALGTPTARVLVETRFLVKTASGWQGRAYQWRTDGSDADLLPGEGASRVTWNLPSGGTQEHLYPSRGECLRCHNASVGPLLGLRRNQLARELDYDGILDDQFRTLEHIGVLPLGGATPLPAPHDPRLSLETRVRGYLAANCAHCHNPNGERGAQDFRFDRPLGATGLCNLLVPGDPNGSRIYQRVSNRPGMPPIGTLQTDPLIIELVGRWISSMSSCP